MSVFKKYGEEPEFFKISFLICSTYVKVSQNFPFFIFIIMSKEIDAQWS